MSQAGIVDIEGSHPQIPTMFVANMGTAVPIANTLEILGSVVAAHSIPVETVASGNSITTEVQYASGAPSSVGTNAGLASFNSADFTVDSNGYVTLAGGGAVELFEVDAATSPGTNPVGPNGSGIVTITGGQVAAGTTTNVIRTNSLSANAYTIQIQRSQAVASSTVGDNGVSHFNSAYFSVDSNGFVSLNGSAVGETITGNTGGALSPTAGNWNILGSSTAAGAIPVQTSGTGSTLTVQVQKAQAIAATNASNVGLAAFNSAFFTVDANGFVSLSGSGSLETLTGNSGGAIAPTAGNINTIGIGSITIVGSGSTLTTQLTGLTNHNVQVGAGTATLTQVAPSATAGIPLVSNGSSADPSFTTAVVAGGGTGNTTFTAYSVICAGTTATGAFQNVSGLGTSGQILTSNGAGALPTWQAAGAASITFTGDSGTPFTSTGVTITGGTTGLTFAAATPDLTLGGTLIVANGGTGRATLTNHGVLIGAGTSAITQSSVGATGTVFIGNTGADPTFSAYPQVSGLGIGASPGSTAGLTFDGTNFMTFYRTGTFSPVIQFGGLSTGVTYSKQVGKYWQIGSVVHFNISMVLSSKGSATGACTFNTLPILSANDGVVQIVSCLFQTVAPDTGYYSLGAFLNPNSGTLSPYELNLTTGNLTGLSNTNFANNSSIYISGTYWTT